MDVIGGGNKMIDERLVRLVWLFCFYAASSAGVYGGNQTGNDTQVSVTQTPTRPSLSDRAKKQLKDKLGSAIPAVLQIVNAATAPLELKDAKVWFSKIDGSSDPAGTPANPINDYAVKMVLRLSNRSERRVTGMGLEFKDPEAKNSFFVYRSRLDVGGGKNLTFEIPFMVMTGEPSHLSVAVYGVGYDYAMTWGSFPVPRYPAPAARPSAPSAGAEPTVAKPPATPLAGRVDSKPRPLNSPQPRYTEQARTNGVCGTVVLRILIGADGKVKRVDARTTLPDWLTEEAIRAAYDLKFEPARKDGQAVAYWMPVVVEFNLK
jgi:TonB family protein